MEYYKFISTIKVQINYQKLNPQNILQFNASNINHMIK